MNSRHYVSEEKKARIAKLLRETDMPYHEIAEALNLKTTFVNKYIKKHNLGDIRNARKT